jgi:predicted AlkP superfamily pyrophosphatase or phosphodiesterase
MTPLMLPVAPKDVGRLSDVLVSALASVGGNFENRLRLPKVKHAVVVLVDGLGYENLQQASGYARFLSSKLDSSIRCEFPSTTATSLTGLATGTRSGVHGLIGYSVYDRKLSVQKNLLSGWESAVEAAEFKTKPSLSELSGEIGIRVIGPAVYETSGFTELTMKGAKYLAAEQLADRFQALEEIHKTSDASVTYLYVPELDQAAHKFGVSSNQWLHLLEELDMILNRFSSKISGNVGVLLTADHGVLDVQQGNHVYLDDYQWYASKVEHTSGDPRCNFVYLRAGVDAQVFIGELQEAFGSNAYVCTAGQLVDAGWTVDGASEYAPDVFLIWKDAMVAYDRRFAKSNYLKMIGQHGGISDVEMRVPIVKLGKY